MSNGIRIPHPLKREGTYQAERFPEALDYAYIKLDERSLTDLVKQSAEYAKFLKYFNELNLEDGNWQAFFEEIYDYSNKRVKFSSVGELEQKASTSPHLALFLAFLRIFNIAQENLNSLTERHLDFYYRSILQVQSRKETADKVPVFFETEKNTAQALVPAGTTLLAGRDIKGKPLCYVTENDLVVNKAKVASIKSIFVKRDDKKNISGVHASADAPVDNALVENDTTAAWLPFGSSANKKAGIGFAIASPVLNLKEGKRRITIELTDTATVAAEGLTVEYTSEKGWTEAIVDINAVYTGQKNKPLYLVVKIDPGQPAVLPYNGKIHQAGLDTVHPVIRFIINDDRFADTYQHLTEIKSGQIKNITVQVSGAKNLLIQNDFGIVDNTKPFPPFGANPVKHKSAVYIGNNDIFNQYLQSFNIALSWKGLPGRIDKYYHTYDFGLKKLFSKTADQKKYFDTEQFDEFTPGHPPGKVSILDNGKWKMLKMNKDADYARDVRYDPARDRSLMRKDNRNVFKMSELEEAISSGFSYEPLKKFDHNYKSGFIKIDLGYDFGHSKFSKIFATAMINRESTDFSIPEQPYTPEFDSLHIEYTSSAKIDYSENKVFRLHAFGNESLSKDLPLLDDFNDEGQLLIGLSDICSPQVVSLYFRMENISGNFEKTINDHNKPRWYYLAGNTWKEFAKSDLLQDTTQKFSGSGIIKFNFSQEAISTHTILADGMVWLKAAVQADSDAFPALEAIAAQAVEALFDNHGNDTSHLETGIPVNTISKTGSKIPGIKKISQPYISYGGRSKEENKTFYTRTSERLRHKNRAWTCWDYERLILEKFPSLLKVKCIPHADQDYEYSPGNVFIILLPDPAKIAQKCPLQPRVSLSMIGEVKEFVAGNTSPFVQIIVKSPEYEVLTVFCNVKLAAGYDDKQFYSNKLNEDLKAFIAPWTNNSVIIPTFSGVLYRSQIINFIEERPYVDYVTTFDVKKNGVSCNEAIRGSEENVLLTSSENHNISTEATC